MGENYIFKYIQIEKIHFKLFHNFTVFNLFNQVNAALVRIIYLFYIEYNYQPKVCKIIYKYYI